jgi:hypothetical protein
LHAKVLTDISRAQETLAKLEQATAPGIGHNKPPDALEPLPPDGGDIVEMERLFREIKAQPEVPIKPGEVRETASKIKAIGERVLIYCAVKADVAVTEMAKTTGKAVPIWALWKLLGTQLLEVSQHIIEWLSAASH